MSTAANLLSGVASSSQSSSYKSQITKPAANWPPICSSSVCPNSQANPSFAICRFRLFGRAFRIRVRKRILHLKNPGLRRFIVVKEEDHRIHESREQTSVPPQHAKAFPPDRSEAFREHVGHGWKMRSKDSPSKTDKSAIGPSGWRLPRNRPERLRPTPAQPHPNWRATVRSQDRWRSSGQLGQSPGAEPLPISTLFSFRNANVGLHLRLYASPHPPFCLRQSYGGRVGHLRPSNG